MGSSWRYCHVTITPYSIGGFYRLARTFSWARLYFFTGSHFAVMDEPVNSLICEKLQACTKQNNKSAQSAGSTFSQHFPTQVSPHYIQLDPIYYVENKGFLFQGNPPWEMSEAVSKFADWEIFSLHCFFSFDSSNFSRCTIIKDDHFSWSCCLIQVAT